MTVSNRLKRHVWLKLIPVRYARHIILPLEVTILLRTYLLPFDPQIMLEVDRIGNMPSVQSASNWGVDVPVVAFAT